MGTIPEITRLGTGRYVMRCGFSAVHIWKSKKLLGWVVIPQAEAGFTKPQQEVFDSLQEAKEYAYDWLAEYA